MSAKTATGSVRSGAYDPLAALRRLVRGPYVPRPELDAWLVAFEDRFWRGEIGLGA